MIVKFKVKIVLTAVIFSLLLPISGYAEECDMDRLKQMAEQVDVTTEFDYDLVVYGIYSSSSVTVSGLNSEIYAVTDDGSMIFDESQKNEYSVVKRNVSDRRIKSLEIKSISCPEVKLRTINIDLKKYNRFADYDECSKLKDKLDVCDEFYDGELTESVFLSKINEYKNKTSETVNSSSKVIINFLKKYCLYIILGVVCFIAAVYGVIRIRNNRLD